MRTMIGLGSPWPESEAKAANGTADFLACSAADIRLFGCTMLSGRTVLRGRGGGSLAWRCIAGCCDFRIVEVLVISRGRVPTIGSRGEPAAALRGLSTLSRMEAESMLPTKADELSEASESSSSSSRSSLSCRLMPMVGSELLSLDCILSALACALAASRCFCAPAGASRTNTEETSLLVTVSRRALSFTASSADCDPRRGAALGEATVENWRRLDDCMGDDPVSFFLLLLLL